MRRRRLGVRRHDAALRLLFGLCDAQKRCHGTALHGALRAQLRLSHYHSVLLGDQDVHKVQGIQGASRSTPVSRIPKCALFQSAIQMLKYGDAQKRRRAAALPRRLRRVIAGDIEPLHFRLETKA